MSRPGRLFTVAPSMASHGASRSFRTARVPFAPRLRTVLTPTIEFETDGGYRGVEYDNVNLSGLDVETAEVEESKFVRANLSQTRLQRVIFTDVVFDTCDLANLNTSDSSLLRTEVTGGRLTGLTWANGLLRDVTFRECRMNLAAFRFSKLKSAVVFRDCDLTGANFQNAELADAQFAGCDLTGAQFSNAKMKGARFEECNLLDIVGVMSFDGATVKSSDALALAYSLASALGITVE